jgi:hypothetical protein
MYKKMLENVPKTVQIYFAGLSEAFLNSESSLMMRYTIEQGYSLILYTTLVGFNDNDLKVLSETKPPSTMPGTGKFPNPGVAFHRFKSHHYNKEEFNKKQNIFRSQLLNIPTITDDDNSGLVGDVWSRAGSLWEEKDITGPLWCNSSMKHDTFDRNVALPNGDVYLCCMDFGLKHKLGNLFETNFYDLNRDEVINLANKEESDLICRKCVICRKK